MPTNYGCVPKISHIWMINESFKMVTTHIVNFVVLPTQLVYTTGNITTQWSIHKSSLVWHIWDWSYTIRDYNVTYSLYTFNESSLHGHVTTTFIWCTNTILIIVSLLRFLFNTLCNNLLVFKKIITITTTTIIVTI